MIRKLFFTSSSALMLFLVTFQSGMSSCTKEQTIIDTLVKTIADTTLTAEILTANPWQPLQVTALLGNTNTYLNYVRGGSNNTQDLDNEFITFNADNTGTYSNLGSSWPFTWQFTDASNKKLVWMWDINGSITPVTWDDIIYKDGAIHYTETYTMLDGKKALTAGIRIPK